MSANHEEIRLEVDLPPMVLLAVARVVLIEPCHVLVELPVNIRYQLLHQRRVLQHVYRLVRLGSCRVLWEGRKGNERLMRLRHIDQCQDD